MNLNQTAIQAQSLSKKFGNKTAVDRISFSVPIGDLFGFLGPNGAGKTTTIRMLTTLASVTNGTATVAGFDVTKDPAKVRASIGVVPQQLTADIELKGIENLLLAAKLQHVPYDDAQIKAKELMKLVELEDSADKLVKTYSGGMKRRLQLIMGLIHTPKILFLDEPTLGLDTQTRTKMWEYIRHLNEEKQLTVFMTTHYLEEADSLCKNVVIIDHGTIRVNAPPQELKQKLGGDILMLQICSQSDITPILRDVLGISSVTRNAQNSYSLKLPSVERALPEIVQCLTNRGLTISDISFTKPTLDQVFLEVTGKSFRDSEAGNGV